MEGLLRTLPVVTKHVKCPSPDATSISCMQRRKLLLETRRRREYSKGQNLTSGVVIMVFFWLSWGPDAIVWQ